MAENFNYLDAWTLIKKVFPILEQPLSVFNDEVTEEEFYKAVEIVKNLSLTECIQTLVIKKIEQQMRDKVAPNFWSYFQKPENDYAGFKQFYDAIQHLHNCFMQYMYVALKLNILREKNQFVKPIYGERNAVDALKIIIRASLLSQLPVEYTTIIENFYEVGMRLEVKSNAFFVEKIDRDNPDNNWSCCFYETNRKLVDLGLLESLVEQVLTSLIYANIEKHVEHTCKDNFYMNYVESLETWLEEYVIAWLKRVYCLESSDVVPNFNQKLTNFLFATYTKARINQLFNIIIEYPESLPALKDLSVCLPHTDWRPYLTKTLQKAMETRLLHPGVSTPDILTANVASIRSMRVLDSSGLLLEMVTQPVHHYLRSREDTVRCVVSSLTEEGPNDLAEELVKGEAVHVDAHTPSDEDSENWETWMPDPVDADPSKSLSNRRTSDIISMLVNVYGSKELFVNEYRTLLADRLLSQFACDTEKEIRYLELLKLRFGDSQLHYCEVMLKDIADSKRINLHIVQDPDYVESNVPISSMIVSAQFWPAFKDEKLELHGSVAAQMQAYTKGFETLKGNRTLCWKNHLGVVDLEVELPDRKLNLSISPVHATILLHFQDKHEWSLDELSHITHVPQTILRRKIGLWQSHGLLVETKTDVFHLVEENQSKTKSAPTDIVVEDYESESAMASTQDQREEELQTFWSYIIGMLMNLDSLPLERIHQMLKMFAFQGPTIECSLQELRQFLDRKVREHKLVYSGGLYRLPKPDGL